LSFGVASNDDVTLSGPTDLGDSAEAGSADEASEEGLDGRDTAISHVDITATARIELHSSERAAGASDAESPDDVVDAEDVAEVLDIDDDELEGLDSDPPPAGASASPKRSPPPPLPRG
jgi:hypothetical protein